MFWIFDVSPLIREAVRPHTRPSWKQEYGDSALAVYRIRQLLQNPRWLIAACDRGDDDWTAAGPGR
jgi:hypothetical protein